MWENSIHISDEETRFSQKRSAVVSIAAVNAIINVTAFKCIIFNKPKYVLTSLVNCHQGASSNEI